MKLLIDIGNSRIKWGTEDGGRISGPFVLEAEAPDYRTDVWDELRPERLIHCAVVENDSLAELLRRLEVRWGLTAERLLSGCKGDAVSSAYEDVRTLGDDRWANFLGVQAMAAGRDHVIIDAGTAVTVDGLTASGHHVGGAIMPGLPALRAGLGRAAPALPWWVSPVVDLPARDTQAAVSGGTLLGFVGGVERLAREIAGPMDQPQYILTGGDAALLARHLPADWHVEPALTLRGLAVSGESACA